MVNINVDTRGLAQLIGKRKWAKAFKEMCEVAEQLAAKDFLEKLRTELPKAIFEHWDRKARNYRKANGTPEDSVVIELMERLSQYKQERFNFYLKSMLQLVEAEIKSSVK